MRNSNSSGPADITAWLDFANNVNEVPVVGDWNGDGIDTVGVYNRSNGIYELVNTNANATTAAITAVYGSPGSWPVIGDWNGDGVDTFAVYNPNTSVWLFSNNPNNAAPSTVTSTAYGVSGDVPIQRSPPPGTPNGIETSRTGDGCYNGRGLFGRYLSP